MQDVRELLGAKRALASEVAGAKQQGAELAAQLQVCLLAYLFVCCSSTWWMPHGMSRLAPPEPHHRPE